ANRGEIACRIIRTVQRLGAQAVAVYSEADTHAPHVAMADVAVCVGPPPVKESYLDAERIIAAGRVHGAEAVHPGYGLLSENAAFAEACEAAGMRFVGPTPEQIRRFGLKHEARAIAAASQVPLLPGSGLLTDLAHALREAERVGYPVMLKSTAGGGGIGMQRCRDAEELATGFPVVERLSRSNFKEAGLFVERWVAAARHVEVQIFGDGAGRVVALGERDCAVQRRNPKVIEETPAPQLPAAVRAALLASAIRLGEAVRYRSAGTVEFVYDAVGHEAFFLEVNTRLQVEHPVTELVTGIDLVEWMLRLAAGTVPPPFQRGGEPQRGGEFQGGEPRGHAIEVRLYAEDPNKDFRPSAGTLTEVVFPDGVRCDGWIARGTEVTPYYDPLLAKLIVHGATRDEAVERMSAALAATRVAGIETNLAYLRQIVDDDGFRTGGVTTGYLATIHHAPATIDVFAPGTHTTVQDHPGRLGYWAVGVPPSGPMDGLALRLANRVVGNADGAAGLECTLNGPTLRFNRDAVICLAGAAMRAALDGQPVEYWRPLFVAAGATLSLGAIEGAGMRTYLAIRGGLDVPAYLGSKATFTLGRFGGHAGRVLKHGDVLHLDQGGTSIVDAPRDLPASLRPQYRRHWRIGVLYGPHGAPDFFTPRDIETFFATDWQVHFNSSRTGVRLVGPKPVWARPDGGEAGLHPSNIHDNPYAIGTVDFTGDMPIILGPDGPSLGGFVCPATVVQAELWKIGQLAPDDTVRFEVWGDGAAAVARAAQERSIATLRPSSGDAGLAASGASAPGTSAVIHALAATAQRPMVVYRPQGDDNLLIEYGPLVLDLTLRFRVHALMEWLQARRVAGIIDLTPGIRSLQVHYDGAQLPRRRVLDLLEQAEAELPAVDDMSVPTRVVRLPLSWDDPATQLAIRKYVQGVRPDAPWCPSNIEFIRRINGLDSLEAVREIVFAARYLVLGLGDVYLGAPVATPLDPRHRLVTTKYNPARTWTPENAVGIGGAYLCVYGMEGPGGYQFVGRTVQMWNRFRETAEFVAGAPWLLRFFDQIQFYPVEAEELLALREAFVEGRAPLDIREETFRLRDYQAFLRDNAASIAAFRARQQAAFAAERERWAALPPFDAAAADAKPDGELELPPGCGVEAAPVPGSVWKIVVEVGDHVAVGDPIVVLESMKMEIPVLACAAGTVHEIVCAEGRAVAAGDALLVLRLAG
ncbi:MAG: urea carboxylase, partial [Deltaproteobacteria bacterium]|nr:urea carboxylase [Deltaproteobacteria bacterium]